jgi:hypothetical protein
MDQKQTFVTVANNFEGLKEAVHKVCHENGIQDEAWNIIREIQRSQIIAIAKEEKKITGKKLSTKLKRKLAKDFNFSEKGIESIIYKS